MSPSARAQYLSCRLIDASLARRYVEIAGPSESAKLGAWNGGFADALVAHWRATSDDDPGLSRNAAIGAFELHDPRTWPVARRGRAHASTLRTEGRMSEDGAPRGGGPRYPLRLFSDG